MIKFIALSAAALIALAADTRADDITDELKTGGLIFLNGSPLRMDEQNLTLSMDEIWIEYTLTNTAKADVESVVAVPMPDLTGEFMHEVAINNPDADDFLGFKITQDGKSVQPSLEQHVVVAGLDRTEDLRRANVPLLPRAQKTLDAIKSLPEPVKANLLAQGLIEAQSMGSATDDYIPIWTLRSAYWWKANFPAGKTVHISYRYKPSLGRSLEILFMQQGKPAYKFKETSARYCMQQAFLKTAADLSKTNPVEEPAHRPAWISYDGASAPHWNRLPSKYKVTIDKGKPENYVSFCGSGAKQTSPTTYVLEPKGEDAFKDLDVLFLVAPQKK
ncbi:DUF4424 family protein [Rhizobium oryzicola]|uniref:DUF4424 family protein n=1 Tax=Rhizobium oryzicola TaxID=1232668 RepID=A0ABT8ST40_9HYPH|nr:DUF4424 family protein [Rhizobium oryzicola]MDO1581254.1 DUF4424 family protein [Rhizobium oryzicola]